MLFTLLTGVRREEAMTLTVNQLDIGRGRFKLFDTKNREDVEIPMSDYVIDLLKRRIADNQGSKFVFPGKDSDKPIGSFVSADYSTVLKFPGSNAAISSTLCAFGISVNTFIK